MKPSTNSRQTSAKKLARKISKTKTVAESVPGPRPGGKLGLIIDRLAAKRGATADDLVTATGWQRHSVLGALSRLRARGFSLRLDTEGDRKTYRLELGTN